MQINIVVKPTKNTHLLINIIASINKYDWCYRMSRLNAALHYTYGTTFRKAHCGVGTYSITHPPDVKEVSISF